MLSPTHATFAPLTDCAQKSVATTVPYFRTLLLKVLIAASPSFYDVCDSRKARSAAKCRQGAGLTDAPGVHTAHGGRPACEPDVFVARELAQEREASSYETGRSPLADAAGAVYSGRMNEPPPLSDIARVAADDFLRGHGALASSALARELATAIELALLTAVRAERRACAAECTRRGELWERTSERADTEGHARLEARHRANEARYLADLIATRA